MIADAEFFIRKIRQGFHKKHLSGKSVGFSLNILHALPHHSPAQCRVPSVPGGGQSRTHRPHSLIIAMSRREAILSLVVMGRREGSGHLEEMAMSSSVVCFSSVEASGMVLQSLSRSDCSPTNIAVCLRACGNAGRWGCIEECTHSREATQVCDFKKSCIVIVFEQSRNCTSTNAHAHTHIILIFLNFLPVTRIENI